MSCVLVDPISSVGLGLHLYVLVILCVSSAWSVILFVGDIGSFVFAWDSCDRRRGSDQERADGHFFIHKLFLYLHLPYCLLPLSLFLSYRCVYCVLCKRRPCVEAPRRFSFVALVSREAPLLLRVRVSRAIAPCLGCFLRQVFLEIDALYFYSSTVFSQ